MSLFYYESLQLHNQSVSHGFALSAAEGTSHRSCLLHSKQSRVHFIGCVPVTGHQKQEVNRRGKEM